jgi:dipeptidyl aminopeptidase/acylaminoacyl peptidase
MTHGMIEWLRIATVGVMLSCTHLLGADLEDFFLDQKYTELTLSPDGATLAIVDRKHVSVLATNGMKALGKYKIGEAGELIKQCWWTNNNRLLVQTISRYTGRVEIAGNMDIHRAGSYYALNADGRRKRVIFGPELGDTHQFEVIDVLPNDEKQIVVQRKTLDKGVLSANAAPEAFLQDVYAKRTRSEIESNLPRGPRHVIASPLPNGDLHADHLGVVRLATGYSFDGGNKALLYRARANADWKDRTSVAIASNDDGFAVLEFDADNKTVFLLTDIGGNTTGLARLEPDSGELQLIYRHKDFDLRPEDIIWNAARNKPIGVTLRGSYPKNHYFDASSPGVKIHQFLDASFPGQMVRVVSKARDNSRFVIRVSADRNPGDYYLFNRKKNNFVPLYKVRDQISRKRLAPMNAFSIRSRDGSSIPGYLTVPLNGKQPYPLVVIPALEFNGEGTDWGFDSLRQYLSLQGYAVLHVNSRGTRGFGTSYRRAGYGNLGSDVLQDILDGTRWSIQQGIADPDSICTFGTGIGGYLALSAAAAAPGLFECAIGYSGVYDLSEMLDDIDKMKRPDKTTYLALLLKTSPSKADAFSLVNRADKITAGVLLLHDSDHRLISADQSKALQTALESEGRKPQWHLHKGESDDFWRQDHRIQASRIIVNFLAENLK